MGRNTAITFSSQVGAYVIGLVAGVLLTRVLGPTGKGIAFLIILVPTIAAAFGNFGLGIATVYYLGKQQADTPRITGSVLILAMLLGIAYAALAAVSSPLWLHHLGSELPLPLAGLALCAIPFQLLTLFAQAVLQGLGRILHCNLVTLIQAIVNLISTLVLVVWLRQNVAGAIFAFLAVAVMGSAASLVSVKRATIIEWVLDWPLMRQMASFGVKSYLSSIANFLNFRLDVFFINSLLGPQGVGLYTVAFGMAESLWHVPGALRFVLFHRTATADRDTAQELTTRTCRHSLLLTTCIALILGLLAQQIITLLYGQSFAPSVTPLRLLLPGCVAFGIALVLFSGLEGLGKPIYSTHGSVVGLVVTLMLVPVLIAKWGLQGAAIASTVAYTASAAAMLFFFRRESGRSWAELLVPQRADMRAYLALFQSQQSPGSSIQAARV